MNDNTLEDIENFTLTIMSTSQRDVTIDGSGQATVNIVDDDSKQIHIIIIKHYMYATPTFINEALHLATVKTSLRKKAMTLTALA